MHPDPQTLQAYFDYELDARAAALGDSPAASPESLRRRLTAALDQESPARRAPRVPRPSRFWLGALCGSAASLAAAALVVVVRWSPGTAVLAETLLDAHLRSLVSTHLMDVVSTDQHTVKPWFAGHADVAPVVADFDFQSDGYRLMGGRAEFLQHQRAAVTVYQHGQHIINVFSWLARDAPPAQELTRDGHRLAFWRAGDLEYYAVSDTDWSELRPLRRLLQQAGSLN